MGCRAGDVGKLHSQLHQPLWLIRDEAGSLFLRSGKVGAQVGPIFPARRLGNFWSRTLTQAIDGKATQSSKQPERATDAFVGTHPYSGASRLSGGGLGALTLVLGALTLARIAALSGSVVDLFPDEAQYWAWSREWAFGYFSKPPLLAWVIAAATAI